MKKWYDRMQNKSIRTKYVAAFLGITFISYAIITLLVYHWISRNEMNNMQEVMSLSLEQADSFVEHETGIVAYASEAMYYNSNVALALEEAARGKDSDLGAQYRLWYAIAESLEPLETGSICDICIYAPDDYIYVGSSYFSAFSQIRDTPEYAALEGRGEQAVWTPPGSLKRREGAEQTKTISLIRRLIKQGDYSQTLCVERVSIPVSSINQILVKADNTRDGCVVILNSDNQVIASSNSDNRFFIDYEGLKNLKAEDTWKTAALDTGTCMVKTSEIDKTDWMIAAIVPQQELMHKINKICSLLITGMFLIMLITTVMIYHFASGFSRRIKRLAGQVDGWRCETKTREIMIYPQDEIGKLGKEFKEMLQEIDGLLKQQYENGRAIKDAELKALQAQINPHFLYNTLDLINWEAMEKDAPEIGELVQMLAKYYKSVLRKGFDEVSLEHEIDHVKTYVAIQNFRFDGRIHLEVKVPDELRNKRMLKLTLQPIVENAILHGIANDSELEEIEITIGAYTIERDLFVVVSDNGSGMSQEQLDNILSVCGSNENSHYAVANIHNRLKLRHGEKYGLIYKSTLGKGTTVTIHIPDEDYAVNNG